MDVEIGKRIKKLEMMVGRLARKAVKKPIAAMVTPYPISNCLTGENVCGPVLKYMFSARGVINKGLIRFDKKIKAGIVITITIENDFGGEAKTIVANRNQISVEPNLEVESGDRLTVSVSPADEEEKLNEVWIAFIWTPHVGEATVKSFLIDQLEKIEPPEE